MYCWNEELSCEKWKKIDNDKHDNLQAYGLLVLNFSLSSKGKILQLYICHEDFRTDESIKNQMFDIGCQKLFSCPWNLKENGF